MDTPDRGSKEPLYVQIERTIRDRILSGDWKPGDQIPSEEQLCEDFGVSRVTIRQALRILADDGLLSRGRGRGTFVRTPTLTSGVRGLRSFTEDMGAVGMDAGSTVLACEKQRAPSAIARHLDLTIGEDAVLLHRLRHGAGQPIGVQRAYLPAKRFPGLENADFSDKSLYTYLRQHYGVIPVEAHERFWITEIADEDARLLDVNKHLCCFRVERLSRDAAGPIEYTASIMRGDRFRLEWVLRREALAGPSSNESLIGEQS